MDQNKYLIFEVALVLFSKILNTYLFLLKNIITILFTTHKIEKCIFLFLIVFCYNYLVGLLVLVTSFLEPNSHGFFCNDMAIKYPYKPSTVGKGFLCVLYLLQPNISVNTLLFITYIIKYLCYLIMPQSFLIN